MKINEQLFKQSGNYGSRINRQTLYKRLQAEGVSKKEIDLVLNDILSKQPKKLTTREAVIKKYFHLMRRQSLVYIRVMVYLKL